MRRRSTAKPPLPLSGPPAPNPAGAGVLRSPYITGIPIRSRQLFMGRDDVLEEIETLLRAADGDEKRDVVLVGRRRIGKTSLLIHLGERAAGHGFVPVQMSLERIEQKTLQSLQDELIRTFADQVRGRVDNVRLSRLGLWGVGLARYVRSFRFALGWKFFTVYKLNDARDNGFERDLLRLVRLVRWRMAPPRYVLVMIDDVHLLRSFESPGVVPYLRGLIQDPRLRDVNFVVTGTDLPRSFSGGDAAQLYDLFSTVRVGGIAKDAARRLISEPIAPQGVDFSAAALELALELTSCIPYWLQCLGHQLVEVLNAEHKRSVGEPEVRRALARLILQDIPLVAVWDELLPKERYAVALLAHRRDAELAPRLVELSRQVGFALTRTEVLELLSRLCSLGILHREGERFLFADNILRSWVEDTKRPDELLPPSPCAAKVP